MSRSVCVEWRCPERLLGFGRVPPSSKHSPGSYRAASHPAPLPSPPSPIFSSHPRAPSSHPPPPSDPCPARPGSPSSPPDPSSWPGTRCPAGPRTLGGLPNPRIGAQARPLRPLSPQGRSTLQPLAPFPSRPLLAASLGPSPSQRPATPQPHRAPHSPGRGPRPRSGARVSPPGLLQPPLAPPSLDPAPRRPTRASIASFRRHVEFYFFNWVAFLSLRQGRAQFTGETPAVPAP